SLIYFANFAIPPFVFRASDAAGVLILERDRATLVTDGMVKVYADRAHVDDLVAPVWYDGRHAAPHRKEHLVRTARDVLAKLGGPRLGLEVASVPEGVLEAPSGARATVELDTIVRRLRRAKDPDEVALIRHSIRAGEAGHAAALDGIRPGM